MFFKKIEIKKFPKVMSFYFSDELDTVIIAPCNFDGEMSSEIDGMSIKLSSKDSTALGNAFLERLTHTASDTLDTSTKRKLREWPAFVASGLKTVKEFQKVYTPYYIRGANEANILYLVNSPELQNGIEMQIVINPYHDPQQIGEQLKKINQFYEKCKDFT